MTRGRSSLETYALSSTWHPDTRTPVSQALAESGPLLPATHASGPPRLYFSPVFISPDVLLGRKVRHVDAATTA